MTRYNDNLYSGLAAATSALASQAPVKLCRTFVFGGASGTQNFVFPTGVQNFDAKLFIVQNGSAATTDTFSVSAGGTQLASITGIGSAGGVLRNTQAGLGTLTVVASAAVTVTTTTEVTAAVTFGSTDAATSYQLEVSFSRLRKDNI